ncbi:hypothetical protein [Archaeoglobus profundus]|uniref:Uncharacterized protein n=2 Tax=root TaxID=1 RepID=D2RFE4_ARCPA|nr:hypothetical protein [Archaeoglobus profundus]ADB58838.1 hypothetical protein Arcpr_1794 [Archaeoglobus profundus DSM 5631]
MNNRQRQQQTIATVIFVLIITEILLHICWKVIDNYFFEDFTVTTQIAILAVIALLFVLFFREELLFGVVRGGESRIVGKKGGGVRNGKKGRRIRKK